MENNFFEIFIRHCGTVEKAAKILGTSHQNVSSMRNGRTWVKSGFARKIARYLWEKSKYKINPLDLISPLERNELKSLSLPFEHHPIKLINVSINHVKCNFLIPDLSNNDQRPLNQLRPILIDENYQLIANSITYFLYLQQQKKTIPAWKISLADLLIRKYPTTLLVQTFLICERASIGIAAKKYLGNRQGPRFHKSFRRNFDEIKGRTDEMMASLLGFGCKDGYRQAEKIQLLGSTELVKAVDEGKLRTSAAALLTRFTHRKQQKILTHDKKEISSFIYQTKKRK
ncbi:MAG: hypothetical protein E6K54_01585 [Gammaproteobacteria bacterium]|nr:MAG: hypothetical protein E6K54_01585 [Gammaproteobacteria bacterium]